MSQHFLHMPSSLTYSLFLLSFLGEIFMEADSSCRVFDEMLKDDCNLPFPISDTVEDPSTINEGIPIFSLSDIIVPREKAEALLPVLVISCLRLNSSSDALDHNQYILQPLFATVYFFNRAKLMPFPIHLTRTKRSELTPKAMAHLHGKSLMEILTPSEESFVRFVVLLEIFRYHSESLLLSLDKYNNLFSNEDKDAVYEFLDIIKKNGVLTRTTPPFSARKPFKGYRTKDIYLFTVIKRQVLLERKNLKNETSNCTHPFTFQYPEAMATTIKLEPDDKKRKLSPSNDFIASIDYSSVAMEFDDGDVAFDYSQVKKLTV